MKININGLFGDLFAIDGFLTQQTKLSVKEVNYIGKGSHKVSDILFIIFPNIYHYTYTLLQKNENFKSKKSKSAIDFNISSLLNKKFTHSSFKSYLCPISKFNLPNDYAFIHLKSKGRQLSIKEIFHIDKSCDLLKVAIGNEDINMKLPSHWLNLINQTNLLEGIEILKNSKLFFGVNSCFSVLADKFLDNILIQCNNPTNKKFYYPLHYNKDIFYDYKKII